MKLPTVIRLFWRSRRLLAVTVIIASVAAVASIAATLIVMDQLRNGSMPYIDSSRQVYVFLRNLKDPDIDSEPLSENDYALLLRGASVFASIGLSTGETNRNAQVGAARQVLRVNSVSASLFRTFGTRLTEGRIPEDWDKSGDYLIVSYGVWRRTFGGDSDAVGKAVELDGHPYVIVGVLPRDFQIGFYEHPEALVPFHFDPPGSAAQVPRLLVFGRIVDTANIRAAQGQLVALSQQLVQRLGEDFKFRVTTIRDQNGRVGREIDYTLLFVGTIFLVAAAANLMTFFSLRMRRRADEFAIREMLGAPPSEAATWLLTEVGFVTLLVLLGGILFGPWLAKVFVTLGPNGILPDPGTLMLSLRTSTYVIVACTAMGAFVFLFVRTLWAVQRQHQSSMRSPRIIATSKIMIASVIFFQSAFAFLLLIMACTLATKSIELTRIGPGFRSHGLLTLHSTGGSGDPKFLWLRDQQVLKEIAVELHAQSEAIVDSLPLVYTPDTKIQCCAGLSPGVPWVESSIIFHYISPSYFDVMQIPVQAGRTISEGHNEVVVSKEFVRQCCAGRLPLGAHLRIETSSDFQSDAPVDAQIVGVVADVHDVSIDTSGIPEIYLPMSMDSRKEKVFIFAFSSQLPRPQLIKAAVAKHGDRTLTDVQTLSDVIDASLRPYRTESAILTILGSIGVLLCAFSVFSLIANAVSERKKELALRSALGASPVRIVWESVKIPVVAVSTGWLCTLIFHSAIARSLQYLSSSADVFDSGSTAFASAVFFIIIVLATLIPALESARISPASVLKEL
ncbi:MAG TPA: ABC transporter permease [Candidatus Acidoferrales bacterium]|nr:ABC transporter permease [Candidatus Acidoferrales bacterium]HEV3480922.1 ABC transporter permease [Candidatus Acidoferrales bacterium]